MRAILTPKILCYLFSVDTQLGKERGVAGRLLRKPATGRSDNRRQFGQGDCKFFVDDSILELGSVGDLAAGGQQPAVMMCGSSVAALVQAFFQRGDRRRQDENAGRLRELLRTWRAPCQSISSRMSVPVFICCSTIRREVP
jgi:hypothetical protein